MSNEQSRLKKPSWIQKLGFRNFFVGFTNSFVGFRNSFVGFRNFFVGFRNFVFRNFLGGFRNYFRRIQQLFSLDSATFFVGFRNFVRWIQQLFSSDSETFFRRIQKLCFVGFRNFSPWIHHLCRTQMLHKIWAKGQVGWGGLITFLGLKHMVDATKDLQDLG